MTNNDPLTLGELGRSLDKLHVDLRQLSQRFDTLVTSSEVAALSQGWQVALDAAERRADAALESARNHAALIHAEHQRRIDGLEAWQTWALRIVVGVVLTALVGVVIVAAPSR